MPSYAVITARLDTLGTALASTRAIRDVAIAGPALDANLAELRAIRHVLRYRRKQQPSDRAKRRTLMNVDEVQTIKAAVGVLETHGYTDAATALKIVLEAEFAKTAQSLHEE